MSTTTAAARSRPRSPRPRSSPARASSATTKAIGSPTWRTTSPQSSGCGGIFGWVPSIWRTLPLHGRPRDAADIGGGQDQADARHRAGVGEVAELDPGVRHGRAEHTGAERSLRRVVVGEAAGAGDQRLVLVAADRRAHAELHRGHVVHARASAVRAASLLSVCVSESPAGRMPVASAHPTRSGAERQPADRRPFGDLWSGSTPNPAMRRPRAAGTATFARDAPAPVAGLSQPIRPGRVPYRPPLPQAGRRGLRPEGRPCHINRGRLRDLLLLGRSLRPPPSLILVTHDEPPFLDKARSVSPNPRAEMWRRQRGCQELSRPP